MPYNNFGQPQVPDMLTPMLANQQKQSQGGGLSSMLGLAGGLMGGYASDTGMLGSLMGKSGDTAASNPAQGLLASTPLNMTIAGKTLAAPAAASPSISGFGSYAMGKLQDPAMKAQLMKMFGG